MSMTTGTGMGNVKLGNGRGGGMEGGGTKAKLL